MTQHKSKRDVSDFTSCAHEYHVDREAPFGPEKVVLPASHFGIVIFGVWSLQGKQTNVH